MKICITVQTVLVFFLSCMELVLQWKNVRWRGKFGCLW